MRPQHIAYAATGPSTASNRRATRRSGAGVLGAFVLGAAIGPAAMTLAGLWLTLAPPPPCSSSFLCFRGVGEGLLSLLVVASGAGIVAQILAHDAMGWLAMAGGIVALAFVYAAFAPPPGGADKGFTIMTALIGVPATAGYLLSRGAAWLWRNAP